jgi:hypothetical protein
MCSDIAWVIEETSGAVTKAKNAMWTGGIKEEMK